MRTGRELRVRDHPGDTVVCSISPVLRQAQEADYVVHLVYVWVSSVQLALARVAARVEQGGHDVPPDTVRRRYWRGLRNLFDLYMPLANTWTLCDNSGVELAIVAYGQKDAVTTVLQPEAFRRIQEQAAHVS